MRATFSDRLRATEVIHKVVTFLNNRFNDSFVVEWRMNFDVVCIRETQTSTIIFSDWAHHVAMISPEILRDNILWGYNPDVLSEDDSADGAEIGEGSLNFLNPNEDLLEFLLGLEDGD